jgi:hypothetical protein
MFSPGTFCLKTCPRSQRLSGIKTSLVRRLTIAIIAAGGTDRTGSRRVQAKQARRSVNKDASFDSISLFDRRIAKLPRMLWRKFPGIDWENKRAIVFGTHLNRRCEFLQELLILSAYCSPSAHMALPRRSIAQPRQGRRGGRWKSTWILSRNPCTRSRWFSVLTPTIQYPRRRYLQGAVRYWRRGRDCAIVLFTPYQAKSARPAAAMSKNPIDHRVAWIVQNRNGSTAATRQERLGPYSGPEANAVYGTVPPHYPLEVIQCRGKSGTDRLVPVRHLRAAAHRRVGTSKEPPGGAVALLVALQSVDNGTCPTVQCGAVKK